MGMLSFKIHGMDCAEEVAVLKQAVGPLVGGQEHLAFDILNAKMVVSPAQPVSAETIVRAVHSTGLRAEPWRDAEEHPRAQTFWERRGRTLMTVVSGAFLVAGFSIHVALAGGLLAALGSEGLGARHDVPLLVRLVYTAGIVAGGWFVAPKAWFSLKRLQPDMNLLMTVAVLGAVGLGEWFEAATVSFLFVLSLTLEAWSVGRARRAIEALMNLAPPTVRLLTDAAPREVPAADVAPGSLFLVKPGERIPLDGEVTHGLSDVNQAPITGESVPVPKSPGTQVFGGTINGDGVLEIRSTKSAGDTTLAHIIRMVGEASSRRAPSERWVEQFARVYTPTVMAAAVLVLLIPPLALHAPWTVWLYRSLVLLVIACPCALVISTPVTIVAALAAAARNGVLVKGGDRVEVPARIAAIAFDKTGTLTCGQPEVTELVSLNGHTETELLARAAAMEAHTNHPIARAIVGYAERRGVTPLRADDFQTFQGKGATARIGGQSYWVGSHRFLEERQQETPAVHERLEAMIEAGQTVVVVGNERHVCGLIGLADAVRPEAAPVVQALRAAGVRHIVMLTGDNRGTAEAIAAKIGVDEIRAELLPADKVTVIEELVAKYRTVAMVGDGVNDAPAMARATIGIAMGAAGSDAAIETADVALMSDDLSKLPWLIRHSRRTLGIVRQNITLSLSVKAVFVVLTFAGAASLWAAIAADMGVSLLVIANALRLLGATSRTPAVTFTEGP
ncbi:MAG: heavy metal translocating P-type ATPase [Vicinamibacterales bacterium]|nr:heavy metal translocating P-type ATPase [Vicinamibacterales bacterium]